MKFSRKFAIALTAVVSIAVVAAVGYGIYSNKDNIDFGEITIDSIPEKSENATRVMSFNVRCKDDEEGSINNRSQIVTAILNQYSPDSFGVQEATGKWIRILKRELGDKYAMVGEPRDFFGPFSEYSAVYYLKDKYNLIDSGTIWLSETPEKKYSVSYDSACRRIATWAVLENKQTGERYTHLNTHLDHVLESTRESQANVLLNKLNELQSNGKVICTGDFNTESTSNVYKNMTAVTDDSMVTAKQKNEIGNTFHGYGDKDEEEHGPIDFIFVTKGTEVERYNIIRNTVDGMYPSDHYPIVTDIIL